MSLAVSLDYTFALSVSADHLLGGYDLIGEVRVSPAMFLDLP